MADPNVERQLREFLAEHDRSRREGKTVGGLHDKQDQMMVALQRVVADRLTDRLAIQRLEKATKTLQHRVAILSDAVPSGEGWRAPKDEEITTGSFALKDIARAQAEMQERLDAEEERKLDEETWWRRQRWLWLGLAFLAVFAASLTGCVGYVSYRIQSLEKALANERAATAPSH
jgi:hypothetical protein